MYGQATPDRLVDALRVLLAARANAAITTWQTTEGTSIPAVLTTIGHPVRRAALREEMHPLLSVVRLSTRHVLMGKRFMARTTIVAEWYASAAPLDALETTWSASQAVAAAMVDALDGSLPNGGENVLAAAGARDVPEESINVAYNYVANTATVYSFFQLRFDVTHTTDCLPLDETAGLPELREMLVKYLVHGRPPESNPQVETIIRTEFGTDATVASDDALDDDFAEDP